MYSERYRQSVGDILREIREAGLKKEERPLDGPQRGRVSVGGRPGILNLCANNYLGLAADERLAEAARAALSTWGYGMASVRFICGTQSLHLQLEKAISDFLGMEDTILYSSCFDANTGLFETLLDPEDAVVSDELNHASVIDGIRLCKARRYRYANNDMADLEAKLMEAKDARFRLIATDGVFSMDGYIANLPAICSLAEKHDALVMVDDSHAVGFLGPKGRGTHEYHNVMARVDIITGTLGKALGGASGGYTSGKREIIALLRQRSRPYLFSNSLAPAIAAASLTALRLLDSASELRDQLWENTRYFRAALAREGFDVAPGEHPIIPVMFGEAQPAVDMARELMERGVYVTPFSFPVVPRGKARLRLQMSAGHTREDLDFALEQFRATKAYLAASKENPRPA